jgi:hypothetical protein
METFVSTSLVQLLCRTVKLAWFDSDAATSVVDDCKVRRGAVTVVFKGCCVAAMWMGA